MYRLFIYISIIFTPNGEALIEYEWRFLEPCVLYSETKEVLGFVLQSESS